MRHFSIWGFRVDRRIAARILAIATMALAFVSPAWAANARAVKARIAPVYPEIAKRMKITGSVRLEAVVDTQGKVKDVKEISGNHMLAIAAEEAVRQWKFAPGFGDTSESVEVTFNLAR